MTEYDFVENLQFTQRSIPSTTQSSVSLIATLKPKLQYCC